MTPFNEKKALAIIMREGLSMTTYRVWQTRGRIPARYTKPLRTVQKEIVRHGIESWLSAYMNGLAKHEAEPLREWVASATCRCYEHERDLRNLIYDFVSARRCGRRQ